MGLAIRERIFSWTEKYDIYNEEGRHVYHVEGEFFSLGHKFHIYDLSHNEVAFVKEKAWSFLHKFEIYVAGDLKGTVKEKLSFFKPKYDVDFMGAKITGDLFEWNYQVVGNDGVPLGVMQRKIFSWANTYYLTASDPKNELPLLALSLAVDAAHTDDENAAFYYYG